MPRAPVVMLVDDDADFVRMNRHVLESAGYAVVEAAAPSEALKKMASERPDIIITDLMMDSLDAGFAFSKMVKSDSRFKGIPIIIATSVSGKRGFDFHPKTPADLAAMNVDAYFDKPIVPKALLSKIEELLASRRLQPSNVTLAEEMEQLLNSKGACLVGFADLSVLPSDVRHDMPRAVCFAVALNPKIMAATTEGPTPEYRAEYDRVNQLLAELSAAAAEFLRSRGFAAVSSAPTGDGVNQETQSTMLPQKTVATLAGLGWIGKNALLITKEYGSAIRLNRVLTDAPLPTATPIVESRCGDCRACVEACPGSAIKGENWRVGVKRDSLVDIPGCRQTGRDIAKVKPGTPAFCGICISACPHTRRYLGKPIGGK